LGTLTPFWGRGAGSPSNRMSLGSRPTFLPGGILIHRAIWTQQIWTKNWGLCPFRGGRPGSLSNIMWPEPSPTYMPSFIWICPTVWRQYTNTTDRTGQDRQQSNSIGQTVLQMVAQKQDNSQQFQDNSFVNLHFTKFMCSLTFTLTQSCRNTE